MYFFYNLYMFIHVFVLKKKNYFFMKNNINDIYNKYIQYTFNFLTFLALRSSRKLRRGLRYHLNRPQNPSL